MFGFGVERHRRSTPKVFRTQNQANLDKVFVCAASVQ
jgi:hypothetical protein